MMAWLYLSIAGIFEIIWTVGMKQSEGFTRLGPSVVTVIGMIISVYLLSLAMRTIPMGTAYAVWTGIGAVGAVVLGMIFFNEPKTVWRVICISLILAGIAGLKIGPR